MKTLGLIGGMSWHSTVVYYKTINRLVSERLRDSYSAKLLLYSVDMHEFGLLMSKQDWEGIENMMCRIALMLQDAGADCVAICSNTPHLAATAIRKKIKIPLLHIAEETAKEITRQKIKRAGLLGTKPTMEDSFYKDSLLKMGVEPVIPNTADRDYIHSIIVNELTKGIFKDETRNKFRDIADKLKQQGAGGVVFGCTEFSLLINPADCSLPVFDTTIIHSRALVDFALSEEKVQSHA